MNNNNGAFAIFYTLKDFATKHIEQIFFEIFTTSMQLISLQHYEIMHINY